MFENILKNVSSKCPLVHNITNYVTVNDCANILLACGSSPIMADDILEVEEITSISDALVINIGTLNSRTIGSMIKAGKKSNELNHVVVLDPVGVGASKLRTDTTYKLLDEVKFSVIRGNVSEIKAIGAKQTVNNRGVDVNVGDVVNIENLNESVIYAKELSEKTGSIIVMTGAIDIVADSQKAYVIYNGHPMMSKISGTGCMLSSIIGGYCAANKDNILEATVAAVCVMGLCGELAFEKMTASNGGTSSLKIHLIDFMSKMNEEILNRGVKIEVK
jgi:hydroxyethylthiazole kinase